MKLSTKHFSTKNLSKSKTVTIKLNLRKFMINIDIFDSKTILKMRV